MTRMFDPRHPIYLSYQRARRRHPGNPTRHPSKPPLIWIATVYISAEAIHAGIEAIADLLR
jgi:hypothetical protein